MTEVSDRIAYSRTRENKTQVSEQRVYDRVQREKLKAGVRERETETETKTEKDRDPTLGTGKEGETKLGCQYCLVERNTQARGMATYEYGKKMIRQLERVPSYSFCCVFLSELRSKTKQLQRRPAPRPALQCVLQWSTI